VTCVGGSHELPWADHSHIKTALKPENYSLLKISTSQRSTRLLGSDLFKKWWQVLGAGDIAGHSKEDL